MQHTIPLCLLCRHHRDVDPELETCEAFPDGIPSDILYSLADHRDPFEGDKNIRFEPLPGIESAVLQGVIDTLGGA